MLGLRRGRGLEGCFGCRAPGQNLTAEVAWSSYRETLPHFWNSTLVASHYTVYKVMPAILHLPTLGGSDILTSRRLSFSLAPCIQAYRLGKSNPAQRGHRVWSLSKMGRGHDWKDLPRNIHKWRLMCCCRRTCNAIRFRRQQARLASCRGCDFPCRSFPLESRTEHRKLFENA